jgi:hypothetical protein
MSPDRITDVVALGLCAAGVLSVYAFARLTALVFPAREGRVHPVTRTVAGLGLVAIVAFALAGMNIAAGFFSGMDNGINKESSRVR